MSAIPSSDVAPAADKPATKGRTKLLINLGGAVVIAALLYGAYDFVIGRHFIETDNAYVGADTAWVSPLVNGPVAQVLVQETQVVKAGDTLVVLDDADERIMVEQARAALDQAMRKVRAYGANDVALAGQVQARTADIARAKADLGRARTDLERRQSASSSGAVSRDELTAAQNAFDGAQAVLAQAYGNARATEGARLANAALISDVDLERNPEVAAARARLDAANLAETRTVIKAPIDGVVSKREVQVGQQAIIGTPLMLIVPTMSAYVDVNFKEVQLKSLRIGQPVTLKSDLYGGDVVFHGRVVGISGGTGAAFSLIPAQNASGNWIKVVQRLPVRVALDPEELARHPLREGLSMKAKIDISNAL
jgi:membrane fusion protein (multidrug efflux system)